MLNSSKDINKNKDEQSTHRVLIFQGGGALGAYEVGVYEALYDNLIEESIQTK